jgi:ParB-like chromosome segregation protein Spo0J
MTLIGLLVPVVVRADGERFKLVAGWQGNAVCRNAGLSDVPVVERAEGGHSADQAVETVLRRPLTALEEARAVAATLEPGYTPDGAATILGWARQRVIVRAKIR